jgi:hypothetical protein
MREKPELMHPRTTLTPPSDSAVASANLQPREMQVYIHINILT